MVSEGNFSFEKLPGHIEKQTPILDIYIYWNIRGPDRGFIGLLALLEIFGFFIRPPDHL